MAPARAKLAHVKLAHVKLARVMLACLLSLGCYVLAGSLLLDRPLTHGALAAAMQARLDRGAAITGKKLVILAGSNAPFSHRCETLEAALGAPCVNAGVAVGIGLDYLFARWAPLLAPGDVLYLPMEPAQYTRSRLATATGPDAAIMARHDRTILTQLAPDRWLGAAFATDLRGLVMAASEMALARLRFADPRADAATNQWGDRIGHTAERAALPALRAMTPIIPNARAIRDGHGTALIAAFTRAMGARGVLVIGGLSVGFDDAVLPDAVIDAIAAIYRTNGGHFLTLPNHSRYPRENFFDGPEHLHEAAQIAHSALLAAALAPMLKARRETLTAAPSDGE